MPADSIPNDDTADPAEAAVQADFARITQRVRERRDAADGLFVPGTPVTIARAPGRLDVMGGIADYSGSLVLEMPIREAAMAAVQPTRDGLLRVESGGSDPAHRTTFGEVRLADLTPGGVVDYERARAYFARDVREHWVAYIAGVLLVLMRERGAAIGGARVLIDSHVPEGKSVSSSAALEVATMTAAARAFGIELDPIDLATLCQRAENLVVGAPCGIMDQMTCTLGRANQLLALLCQPAVLQGYVALPPDVALWGIDSGVRHAVTGADYASVRVGAFMGYRIIADLTGLTVRHSGDHVDIDDSRWGGYLANIPPDDFDTQYTPHLPERVDGRSFLARYGGTTDRVTRIDPARTYAVRVPAAHPVHEHARVRQFVDVLRSSSADGRRNLGTASLECLGQLMYASHAAYTACGLGSPGTDLLVELVRQRGPAGGLYGAKITGGGSGGTVAVLAAAGADESIHAVAAEYAARTGHRPYIFSGSSPGASTTGVMQV